MTVELLTVDTVPAYLAAHPELAAGVDPGTAAVREVGDGNLNLVFIAEDAAGASVVLKQSLPYVRTDHSWAVPQDRIFAEARGYEDAARVAPGSTAGYHGLDPERRLIALEDLSSWTVWRTALNEGRVTPGAGGDLGRYVARLAFGTSAFGRPAAEVRAAAAGALNIELCRITEDLVFTEPFRDHEHNGWDAEVSPAVLALRDDAVLAEVAELKWRFLTAAEGRIHGDLHTGSVFVAPPGTEGVQAKAFDLEFGVYGPVAFDLGALFGNVLLAQSRAAALGRPEAFRTWVAGLVGETWAAFEAEFRRLWPQRVDSAFTDRFLEDWLRETWHRAVGFGGVKAVRRVVGWAKVSDVQTLEHDERVKAAGAALTTARRWITERQGIPSAAMLADVTREAVLAWR
ncbi:S-methyl-5-thioribose kinase [Amnibacterium kyonggiense]|uniref:5'-methylthioribose kinase n=1 Tax=Amnibacterium kyonggiense TaxID=595671 RepID=A0A4R7FSS6_9MICO|nr:S-methyl-5-thioribose kinase [Amnibacterium kyonggiense]TDS80729.1 5'-methylthioribose kinase [Amnibacterium kyonggiense]